jgi:hypothetical protein
MRQFIPILLLSCACSAQFSKVNSIGLQQSGTDVSFFTYPFKLNFAGCTVGTSGNIATITCTGGAGLPAASAAGQQPTWNGSAYVAVLRAIDVRDYGAKCDGTTNDTTAVNNAIAAASANAANGTGTAEVVFPSGICLANMYIQTAKGLRIHGTGQLSTRIRGIGAGPALQINGLWYSSFADMSFDVQTHTTASAVVEIDGNYDGTHTQGVQFLTFNSVAVFGQGASDGLLSYEAAAVCRQSNGGCQGSNLKFDTVAFSGCSTACYFQNGYNALANVCLTCDFQFYTKWGAFILNGDMGLYSSTAESVHGWTQYVNGGCDIYDGAAYYAMPIYDFRSESVMFLCGTGAADVRGLNTGNSTGGALCIDSGQCSDGSVHWAATTAYSLGAVVFKTQQVYSSSNPTLGIEGNNLNGSYYVVTTAGTSGSSQPSWPYTGTVTDGSVVWTQQSVHRINISNASVDSTGLKYYTTGTSGGNNSTRPHQRTINPSRTSEYLTYNTVIDCDDEFLLADASSQNISITIGGGFLNQQASGQQACTRQPLYIRRIDAVNTSAGALHTVTIYPVIVQGTNATEGTGHSIQLPPDGYVELTFANIDGGQQEWVVTGGNYLTFGNTAIYTNSAVAGAVTLNAKSGYLTSESLTTAAGSDYVLTFTNNRISPNSIVQVNVMNGTNSGGVPTLATVNTTTSGQATIDVHNDGSSAFNGTLVLKFLVL